MFYAYHYLLVALSAHGFSLKSQAQLQMHRGSPQSRVYQSSFPGISLYSLHLRVVVITTC